MSRRLASSAPTSRSRAHAGRALGRRNRRLHGFDPAPLWADLLKTSAALAFVAAFVGVMNATTRPRSDAGRGIPVPVLVAIVTVLAVTALSRATRFGRYVFAMGGNPEAAALAISPVSLFQS